MSLDPEDRSLVRPSLEALIEGQGSIAAAEISAAEQLVDELGHQLRAAVRALHEKRARQRAVAGVSAVDIEHDVAMLARLPDVAGVSFSGDLVTVETGPILVERDGVMRELGTFLLRLSPTSGIRVLAGDVPQTGAGWIHPHVQADRPCLGNARVGVEKLLAELQYFAAGEVLLRFLKVYEDETAYCDLSMWPLAEGNRTA